MPRRLFDTWGFDRCLWETDWTRGFAVVNYERAVEPLLKPDRLSGSAGSADGRRYRQDLRLVTEEGLAPLRLRPSNSVPIACSVVRHQFGSADRP
jgi:hypothetical protein